MYLMKVAIWDAHLAYRGVRVRVRVTLGLVEIYVDEESCG